MVSESIASGREQRRQEFGRLLELRTRAKDAARLTPLEQARLEIETQESVIDVLLSVHREPSSPFDWCALACALKPVVPQRQFHREQRVRQCAILAGAGLPSYAQFSDDRVMALAHERDEQEFREAVDQFRRESDAVERRRDLAERVMRKDPDAFATALTELDPLGGLPDLHVLPTFSVHSERVIECRIRVNAMEIIPSEASSLSMTGGIVRAPLSMSRRQELLQGYVCACVLRVGREILDFLPAEAVLVTATIDFDGTERPVMSAAIVRAVLDGLDLHQLDAASAVQKFLYRGDVWTLRPGEELAPVEPLTPADVQAFSSSRFEHTQSRVRELREQLKSQHEQLAALGPMIH
jgi:hypothetical protein